MARRRGRGYNNYSDYPVYVSAGEKKAKAEKSLMKLKQKKNSVIKPVIIEGMTITKSWWGKSWNKNLEGYADYHNRISRGRSYVRNGAVLDLQITAGNIMGLVQGTRSKPYSITILINEITPSVLKNIKKACSGKLDSLTELLAGKFPKELAELFTEQGKGLFPSPKEIHFSCTCPDFASMCKHVAAVLYGVSARLDCEPDLFFTLRKIAVNDLVGEALQSKSKELLDKAKKKSSRVLEDSDLSAIFGIQMENNPEGTILPTPATKPIPPIPTIPSHPEETTLPLKKTRAKATAKKKTA